MKWVTTSTPSKTDLTYEVAYNPQFVPLKSPKVSVRAAAEGDKTTHLMLNLGTDLVYELDEAAKTVWDLIDGKRSVQEIVGAAKESGKKVRKDETVIESLLFFAETSSLQAQEDVVERRRVRVISSFITEVTLIWDATRIFKSIHKVVRPLLRESGLWASMALILTAAAIYSSHFISVFGNARTFQVLGSTVVGFLFYNYVILGPVVVVHELSHGVALVHYTGKASEVGTGLFYFGPMFYVNVAGYWSLPRRQRIMIMWAGSLSTLLIGSSVVLIELLIRLPDGVAALFDLVAFWCFYLTLWNLAPPFETDGYHILADALNQPNLRTESFSLVKASLLRLLRRGARREKKHTLAKNKVLFGYAVFAILFLTFIGFQTLRLTSYMAYDSAIWARRFITGLLPNQTLSPFAYAIGITTISYFALTLSGYGVLLRNQLRRIFTRGLSFESLHDRDLSVFFYVPTSLYSRVGKDVKEALRSAAKTTTSNFSVGRRGPLHYANLRIGGTQLPLTQIKPHLRKIERRFFQVHQELVASKAGSLARDLMHIGSSAESLDRILSGMAGKALPDRLQSKASLREFLDRQDRTIRYLMTSTFATVWTIEVPPGGQYELLTSLFPSLLVEDIVMTDLPEEAEEFKKQVIYGLDTIADLAASDSSAREEALSQPEKYQTVVSFEPVRGRVIFVGRTEWIESRLIELGSLFGVQVWSGYVDNMLGDANLHLYSVTQSLPLISPSLDRMSYGEITRLQDYASWLERLEGPLSEALDECQKTVRRAQMTLIALRSLFRSQKSGVALLDKILELNAENLQSIPSGTKEVEKLSKESFSWARSLKKHLESELRKRVAENKATKKKMGRLYSVVVGASLVLATIGLVFSPGQLLIPAVAVALALQLVFVVGYYVVRSSSRRISRHPSSAFTQVATSIYAVVRTLGCLVVDLRVLDLAEALPQDVKIERRTKKGIRTAPASELGGRV